MGLEMAEVMVWRFRRRWHFLFVVRRLFGETRLGFVTLLVVEAMMACRWQRFLVAVLELFGETRFEFVPKLEKKAVMVFCSRH